MSNTEIIYCATCKKEISNIEELSQHNLKHVIAISSAIKIFGRSEILSKTTIVCKNIKPIKQGIYEKYILPFRKQRVHLYNNGLSECGLKSSRHKELILSKNPNDVTCIRCKKTYIYQLLAKERPIL